MHLDPLGACGRVIYQDCKQCREYANRAFLWMHLSIARCLATCSKLCRRFRGQHEFLCSCHRFVASKSLSPRHWEEWVFATQGAKEKSLPFWRFWIRRATSIIQVPFRLRSGSGTQRDLCDMNYWDHWDHWDQLYSSTRSLSCELQRHGPFNHASARRIFEPLPAVKLCDVEPCRAQVPCCASAYRQARWGRNHLPRHSQTGSEGKTLSPREQSPSDPGLICSSRGLLTDT